MNKISFIDLKLQQKLIRKNLDVAIKDVLDQGAYVMGPQVKELEKQLADFCGAKHAISCSNGSDALLLLILAENITANDAVFIPSFTFPATAEVISLVGATPFFVDVQADTFNIDPKSLVSAIKKAKAQNLNPKAVISVDLFGQPANYSELNTICNEHNIKLFADAAQSFGASYQGKPVGSLGFAATTSFSAKISSLVNTHPPSP